MDTSTSYENFNRKYQDDLPKSGWVRAWRHQFDNPLFKKKPLCELAAWIWLYSNAAHCDSHINVVIKGNGHVISRTVPVKRGELIISLRQLERRWNWHNPMRVRRFLRALQSHGMLHLLLRDVLHQLTRIVIINYDKYNPRFSKDVTPTVTPTVTPVENFVTPTVTPPTPPNKVDKEFFKNTSRVRAQACASAHARAREERRETGDFIKKSPTTTPTTNDKAQTEIKQTLQAMRTELSSKLGWQAPRYENHQLPKSKKLHNQSSRFAER